MANIENDNSKKNSNRSKKSKKTNEEAAEVLSNVEESSASEQLKALVEAAQVEWQILDGDGVEFTEEAGNVGLTEMEAAEIEAVEEENQPDELETTDEAVEFIEADHAVSIIESLLFSSDKPVSLATFKQIFKGTNIKSKDITRAVDGLASEYASAKRGVTIEEINGGFQLRTKSDNSEYLRRLSKTRPFKLSGPALEVLSIIAYKQPCVKSELDEIRGVESGHLLRALMERGLCSFAGKSELPGKPMMYQTTRKFLEIFGLRNLRELPTLSEIDELIPEGIGDEEPEQKQKLSDITGDLSREISGNYSEGEEDLLKITDQLQQINTSSDFFEQEKIRQREKREFEKAQNIREALTVGEAVDSKDQKWLARYEAKLSEASLQAEAALTGETIASAADEVSEDASLQALATVEESIEESLVEEDSEVDSSDDLAAMPDWDEEA